MCVHWTLCRVACCRPRKGHQLLCHPSGDAEIIHFYPWRLHFIHPFVKTLPWYNRTGWLGVKHQVTYFVENWDGPTWSYCSHEACTNSFYPSWICYNLLKTNIVFVVCTCIGIFYTAEVVTRLNRSRLLPKMPGKLSNPFSYQLVSWILCTAGGERFEQHVCSPKNLLDRQSVFPHIKTKCWVGLNSERLLHIWKLKVVINYRQCCFWI